MQQLFTSARCLYTQQSRVLRVLPRECCQTAAPAGCPPKALEPPALQPPSRTPPSGRCPQDAYFLAVIAVFLAPRSFLTRFFRSFMFLRDRCTLVSSPFCRQRQHVVSGPKAWAQRGLLRASGMRAAMPDVASPLKMHAAHTQLPMPAAYSHRACRHCDSRLCRRHTLTSRYFGSNFFAASRLS